METLQINFGNTIKDLLNIANGMQRVGTFMQNVGSIAQNVGNRVSNTLRTSFNAQPAITSIGSLQSKLNELYKSQANAGSLGSLKAINQQIRQTENQISNLQNKGLNGLGGKMKEAFSMGNLKQSIGSLPGAQFLANPYVAVGGALAYSVNASNNFAEGMAKINTTAQLSKTGLSDLQDELLDMGKKYSTSLENVPMAFEKIVSQTGYTKESLSAMETALKLADAGFTNVDVTAGALGQTLSAIGTDKMGNFKATAKEIGDVFTASKRLGAGEFEDFARYLPGLIAQGKNLNLEYKEVAGVFSYFTSQGKDAASSAMLMSNMFTALTKPDILEGLQKQGIAVFDNNGNLRNSGRIFSDLADKMGEMSSAQKIGFLDNIGLKDAQAKEAFAIMAGNTDKLKDTLIGVGEASKNVELEKALTLSENPNQAIGKFWNNVKGLAIDIGTGLTNAFGKFLMDAEKAFQGLDLMFQSLGKWLDNASNDLGTMFDNVGSMFNEVTSMFDKPSFSGIAEKMGLGIQDATNTTPIDLQNMGKVFGDIGKNQLGGLESMGNMFSDALKPVTDVVNPYLDKLGGSIKKVMDNKMQQNENSSLGADNKGNFYFDDGKKKKSKAEKGLDEVSGGGSKQTNITINLDKLQDKIEIHSSTIKESASDVEKILIETLIRVLNSTNQYRA